jgi:DNA-binding XRE family transcriptional regulator
MPTMNELDNDVIIKINTPTQSTSVSLATAICRFLDKGLNYIFFFTKNLFDNLRYSIINNL